MMQLTKARRESLILISYNRVKWITQKGYRTRGGATFDNKDIYVMEMGKKKERGKYLRE
jgi:hypothetical protein